MLLKTESVSSADHVAPAQHRQRRRRSNRVSNRRGGGGGASRPPVAFSSASKQEDQAPPPDSLENGVAADNNGASDNAKPQRRPRDKVPDTDAAVTTKHWFIIIVRSPSAQWKTDIPPGHFPLQSSVRVRVRGKVSRVRVGILYYYLHLTALFTGKRG